MSILAKLEEAGNAIIVGAVSAVIGGVGWIIRRVLTNQKQIELLQSEIRHRDAIRAADREVVQEIKDDVKAMRSEISEIARGRE